MLQRRRRDQRIGHCEPQVSSELAGFLRNASTDAKLAEGAKQSPDGGLLRSSASKELAARNYRVVETVPTAG